MLTWNLATAHAVRAAHAARDQIVELNRTASEDDLFAWGLFGYDLEEYRAGQANVNDRLPDLLREVVGNPFRPVAFAPEWRTASAVALAEAMYQSRDFGPMPVLADALEEAGCADTDVRSHCRGDGPHVRGCWVVDLVLGKA